MSQYSMNKDGYTVDELRALLGEAVSAGNGKRRVLIGPTVEDEQGTSEPCAISVIGVECNDDYETQEYWLYPGNDSAFLFGVAIGDPSK